TFLDQLFAGLGLGFILFFSAAGLNLVWGVLGVMNFAAGAVYMLGAYLATTVIGRVGASTLGWVLALTLVPLLAALAGAAVEVVLLRRTYREHDENQQFMLTLALSYLLAGGIVLVYGAGFRTVALPASLSGSWGVLRATLPMYTAVVIVLGVLVTAALVPAFIVVVTGGLGNMTGALIAAVAIGVIESFVTLQSPTLAPLTPYAVMTLVLLARAASGRRLLATRSAVSR